MKYVTLIVLLMIAIGLCYMAEYITTPTHSERLYEQVVQQLKELASSEGASGAIKEAAETMKKARRSAEISATFRHGFHVWSMLASVGALATAFWITFNQSQPNKTPLPTPVERPPSKHDQVPGAADL